MINTDEQKWATEAEKEFIDFYGTSPKSEPFKQYFIQGAVLTRKKAHSEKDDLIIILKMKLNGSKEKVKELDQEIAQLKEKLKRERKFIQELKVYILNDTENYDGEEYVNMIQTQQQGKVEL